MLGLFAVVSTLHLWTYETDSRIDYVWEKMSWQLVNIEMLTHLWDEVKAFFDLTGSP